MWPRSPLRRSSERGAGDPAGYVPAATPITTKSGRNHNGSTAGVDAVMTAWSAEPELDQSGNGNFWRRANISKALAISEGGRDTHRTRATRKRHKNRVKRGQPGLPAVTPSPQVRGAFWPLSRPDENGNPRVRFPPPPRTNERTNPGPVPELRRSRPGRVALGRRGRRRHGPPPPPERAALTSPLWREQPHGWEVRAVSTCITGEEGQVFNRGMRTDEEVR